MPIFEQGYRAYTGPVRKGSRALAIAWESIRPRMRWWIWLLAFMFSFWPFLVMFVVSWLVLVGKMMKAAPASTLSDVVNFGDGPGDPLRLLAAVQANTGAMFWEVLNDAFAASGPVVLATVACAGILASDRKTGALQIYFARPVTRLDYLLGKILAVAAFCSILTWVPTLVLWAECAAFQSSLQWVADTWYVPFSILIASMIYTVWAVGLVLLLSSIMQRPVLIGTVAIFTYFFLLAVGNILGHALDQKAWFALIPHYAIGAVTAPLFGLKAPDWLPAGPCLLMAFGFPAFCFLVVVRRLRAVEVVT